MIHLALLWPSWCYHSTIFSIYPMELVKYGRSRFVHNFAVSVMKYGKKKGTALTLEERYRVQRLPRWTSVIYCSSRAFRGGECNLKIRAQCGTPQTSRVCFLLDMKKKEHKPLKRRIVFITLCLDGHVASTLHPARLSHRASKHTAKRRP